MTTKINDFVTDLNKLIELTEKRELPPEKEVTRKYELNYLKRILGSVEKTDKVWFEVSDADFVLTLKTLKASCKQTYSNNTQLGVFRGAKSVEKLIDKHLK